MADSLADLVRSVWEKMRLAGEAGSPPKIEEEFQVAIGRGQEEWEERLPCSATRSIDWARGRKSSCSGSFRARSRENGPRSGIRRTSWYAAPDELVGFASEGGQFQRQLFAEDARQGLGSLTSAASVLTLYS